MKESKKEKQAVQLTLTPLLVDVIEEMSAQSGVTRSIVVEMILREEARRRERKGTSWTLPSPGRWA